MVALIRFPLRCRRMFGADLDSLSQSAFLVLT